MCFSAEADFTAGVAVATVGVFALQRVRGRRELIVGSLPLLLGAHQFVEGFVWLGLQGRVSSGLQAAATETYVVFAHPVLPALVPLGFALLERDRVRARWSWLLAGLGGTLGGYLLWQVTAFPVGAHEQGHCIDYTTHTPNAVLIVALYVLVTCGPALLSSHRYLRRFGLVSLLGLAVAGAVRAEELTSLWCVYVAVISVLILEHFRRQRASETRRVTRRRVAAP